jgi:D-alanyl-D-alanine carboxypeptidase
VTRAPRPTRLGGFAIAAALAATLAIGQGTDTVTKDPVPPPATGSATTTSNAGEAPNGLVQRLIDDWARTGRGGVSVALAGRDDELTVAAAGSAGPDGGTVGPDSEFRVGSLSKTFVAVMLLQLVADGSIGLDDPVVAHAADLTIAEGVTIRQLLAHRSGIPEHDDGELAPAVLADPGRSWTPTDVLDLVVDQPRDFPPGAAFAYSNTNYIVAGLLLERVTGVTLSDNLRSRITEPLDLTSTYFAPDGQRSPIGGFSNSLPGGDTNGDSYRALETAAGAAGALVSTAADLATFLRALAHGELLDPATYREMTSGLPAEGQTLGVFPADPASTTGISNSGALPGFIAYMQYDPSTEDLFVLLANDEERSPEQLGNQLLEIVRDT